MMTLVTLAVAALLTLNGCERPRLESEGAARRIDPRAPVVAAASAPPRPVSFREAKKYLRKFYERPGGRTIYSDCAFPHGSVAWQGCCLREETARRSAIEWEHVVPAATFGGGLAAWHSGDPRCLKKGRAFRGRRCARRVSPAFNQMEGDMHNLFPEIGHVNAARGDWPMGQVEVRGPREGWDLGSCDLAFGNHLVEPRAAVRGEVARAYLYMNAVYARAVPLEKTQRELFQRWHEADPPDDIERARNEAIAEVQGNHNPWID